MAKVSGAYESVIRGVSEQVPQDRLSGQHSEQINMISDPVRGLARRHGSVFQDELDITAAGTLAAILDDTQYHKVYTFRIDGNEYDLIYRATGKSAGNASAFICYDRGANRFIPVTLGTTANVTALLTGGVSAITNVGRYLYIAGASITPNYTTTELYSAAANKQKGAVWVRGGAYSRTYKVTVTKTNGAQVSASYTTMSASYPGSLYTGDIAADATDYQKQVNDRVFAYNTAVTQYIGQCAQDITPENIATKLAAALNSAGITGCSTQGGTVLINNANVSELLADDGGDGTLMRAVGNTITNTELVSTIHYVGKIVKVSPQKASEEDSLYLKATAKDVSSSGWTRVVWKECAGTTFQPTSMFCMATIIGGMLYLGGDPAELATLTGSDVPPYEANAVGDSISCPLPAFFGKKITWMGVHQDRLVVASGSTLNFSRPGDYLNFWRGTVLSVLDTDPWEGYALGAEDDTIKWHTTWNRDLYLYGSRFQYIISGKSALTPQTASIVTSSSYKDATDAEPQTSGNFVFYAKYSLDDDNSYKTSLHQVGVGQVADSPESYEVSQQLDSYIQGKPVQIVSNTAPNVIALRTDGDRRNAYIYGYLDTPDSGQRLFDAWSKWVWADPVGSLMGMSASQGSFIMYVVRQRGAKVYVAAERFSLNSKPSLLPYADSLLPYNDAATRPSMAGVTGAIVALGNDGGPAAMMGTGYDNIAEFLTLYPTELNRAWVGFPSDAYVTPTNPYMKDYHGKPILSGRMTLSQVRVTVADTGGLEASVTTKNGTNPVLNWGGRVLGTQGFKMGSQNITSTILPVTIGKEVRECQYTLKAKTWLPLTITNIEWTAQVFNNTRRA